MSRAVIASRPDSESPRPGRPYRSLRGHGEFARAYRTGLRRRRGAVTTLVAEGLSGPPTVGFVAGKKVGSAVDRNRAKRRMREAVARCSLKADTVYVVVADRGVVDVGFDRLVEWVGSTVATDTPEELR